MEWIKVSDYVFGKPEYKKVKDIVMELVYDLDYNIMSERRRLRAKKVKIETIS